MELIFRRPLVLKFAPGVKQHLAEGSTVISDGLACFNAVQDAGCLHDQLVCGGGRASVEEPEFYWVNTILGNLKSGLPQRCIIFDELRSGCTLDRIENLQHFIFCRFVGCH